MNIGNKTIIIKDQDQFDLFMELKSNIDLTSACINELIIKHVSFGDFKEINRSIYGDTEFKIENANGIYEIVSKLFRFINKISRVVDYVTGEELLEFYIYGTDEDDMNVYCEFELKVSEKVSIKCEAYHTKDKWVLDNLTTSQTPNLNSNGKTKVTSSIYDDYPDDLSEMTLYGQTFKNLDMNIDDPKSLLLLFRYISGSMNDMYLNIYELLQILEGNVKIVDGNLDILKSVHNNKND